ncbi:hypothetical protein ABK040_015547 [Willaertia magna]
MSVVTLETLTLIKDWINDTNKSEEVTIVSDTNEYAKCFFSSLKDGLALCKLISKIKGRFLLHNKNCRDIKELEIENLETFCKEALLLISASNQSIEFINRLKGKVLHDSFIQFINKKESKDDLNNINYLLKVLKQLSIAAISKTSFKGSPLLLEISLLPEDIDLATTTTSTASTSNNVSSSSNSSTVSLSSMRAKTPSSPTMDNKKETLNKEQQHVRSGSDVEKELRKYKQEQMEIIKQEIQKFKAIEEEKIKKEMTQLKQNMLKDYKEQLQNERKQQELEKKPSITIKNNNSTEQQQDANVRSFKDKNGQEVIVRFDKSVTDKNSPRRKQSILPFEGLGQEELRSKVTELTERLTATEQKYEKIVEGLKSELQKKQKEVERLDEENILLTKKLKKLKSDKVNDGLEQLEKEEISNTSIKTLQSLLNSNDQEVEDMPVLKSLENSNSTTSIRRELPTVIVNNDNNNGDNDVEELLPSLDLDDSEMIQFDEPTLMEMSDEDDDLELRPINTARRSTAISRYGNDEELFATSVPTPTSSNNGPLKKKKTILGSLIKSEMC